ncbi:pseudouridine synthase [Rhodocaloribacter sp.]
MATPHRKNRGKYPRRARKPSSAAPGKGVSPPPLPPEGMRLNRYISQAGVCSRRKADDLIKAGRVKVNGEVITEMGRRVSEGDVVEVGGERITPQPYLYVLMNKPKDTITTTDDERDRTTVMDLLDLPEKEKAGLFPVGRLDRNTTGVLVLTNDGELAHRLMHPSYEIVKRYRVRTEDPVKPDELARLREGIPLEDGVARADQAVYVSPNERREIGIELHEGRNRQVRRMLEALGHRVVGLERVNYAGLTTEGIRRGKWRRLDPREIRRLRRQVKLKG